jgi:DNA polymerase bacteriophage-type
MTVKYRRLNIDFETASEVDLRRTGVYPYSIHPSTRVLCMGYAFDDLPRIVWRIGQPFPQEVLDHVASGGRVDAWNAGFEYNVWNNTLIRQLRLDASVYRLSLNQVYDTMARAAYFGLPLSLDMAASAARVSILKDKAGHALMLRMCRPRATLADGTTTWWHEDDPQKFDALCDYCGQDVDAERAVGNALPEMPDSERQVWLLDQKINRRGVHVDLDLVARLKELAKIAVEDGNAELAFLTGGAVRSVNSTASLLAWLQGQGSPITNLQKATVAERLDDPACAGLEREALLLRSGLAKTSAAKLEAMETATGVPSSGVAPIRGMLQYYGAFRTGRWAGRLVQPQNMPRGEIAPDMVPAAIKVIMAQPDMRTCAQALTVLFGGIMSVVTTLLRSCFVPGPGKTLVVSDFAQIEARVLPWLAGQQDVLDVFASGEDVYVQAAAGIFGVRPDQVTKDQRQIGKVAILALGYGGGANAFQTMASAYGITVDPGRADQIKRAWRAANPFIVQFWWDLDAACRAAINTGTIVHVGKLKVGMWGAHMVIVLPSNRGLFYRDARLQTDPDTGKAEITYMGLNQYTRKWERLRTYGGKLAENVTQAVARDVMAETMLKAEAAGIHVVLTVHDELLAEAPAGTGDSALKEMENIMSAAPAWAAGLPVGADGWHGPRYKK